MRSAWLPTVILSLILPPAAFAQSTNAAITGIIDDPAKAVLPGVSVTAINTKTGEKVTTRTNNSGQYTISALIPGTYRIEVDRDGFTGIIEGGLTLHTQDIVQLNFHMAVGSSSETVTVNASENNINTTDATVGSTIDRQFVQDIPLNGRSFQNLVLLMPGTTTASPQGSDDSGEYSVNGQRTSSNSFTLDGASAMNHYSLGASSPASTGSASNATALGTTQSIVSLDALQEVRIATSTYSAEFGRTPGAQVSFTSRSGTNDYHGTAFNYLRNYAFDANNWFNTYSTAPFARPQERQNDFGGTLGGPLSIPRLFSARDRAFFFFNYEGLRLGLPGAASIMYVPSNGTFNTATYSDPRLTNLRATAPAPLQPALNGFPLPNCSIVQDPQCVDHGDGLLPFIYTGSSQSTIDSLSGRIDYQLLPGLRTFARYSDAESSSSSIGPSGSNTVTRNRTYLLGTDSVFHESMTNELRLQYSTAYGFIGNNGIPVGGQIPVNGPQTPNFNSLQGLGAGGQQVFYLLQFPGGGETSYLTADNFGNPQFQSNAVDTLTWTHGRHVFKAGADYRQTTVYFGDGYLSAGPQVQYYFESGAEVFANTPYEINARTFDRQDPTTKNLGTFVQDEWRLRPRLSLSLGLRWDFNPPPSISGTQQYTYTGDINNPSTLAISRLGAPLYKTTYDDFAPRAGIAITLRSQPGHELVLRTGGGLFYDTGNAAFLRTIGSGSSPGAALNQYFGLLNKTPGAFPLSSQKILAPIPNQPAATQNILENIISPNFVPPSTVQWSASLEQALGTAQSLTIGYIGTDGLNLAVGMGYSGTLGKINPLFNTITEYENGASSNYNGLHVQYRREMVHGFQALASYTWAHALDDASTSWNSLTGQYSLRRGNSDHDVRETFTAALVYHLPNEYDRRWQNAVLGHWSTDLRYAARTGFPVAPIGPNVTDNAGNWFPIILNYNGQRPYVHEAGIPGRRQFNPAILSLPSTAANGNEPRNFLRGFGEDNTDLAVERVFPLYEQVNLQFRAESFNVFNHPNFGAVNQTCGTTTLGATCNNTLFGQATGTLSNASMGGLSPLYQQGGPRSLQFALKLQF